MAILGAGQGGTMGEIADGNRDGEFNYLNN